MASGRSRDVGPGDGAGSARVEPPETPSAVPAPQIGKYRTERLLGQGAMGDVYLAEDPDIGRNVAIKVLKTSSSADRERFLHEARIVGALSHPNIVVLHDAGFQDDRPYLVMEWLAGTDLGQWLESEHTLSEHLRIMEGLCLALDYAHANGVLHRDLKPSNIQVLPDGRCKLIDFGIARAPSATITASGAVMGTPSYLPPEILMDTLYSTRADIYSAGLVLYEMLAGRNPFAAKTVAASLHSVLTVRPPHLSNMRPDLPSDLADAIMSCLSKDPHDRPQDFSLLLDIIRRLRAGASDPAIRADAWSAVAIEWRSRSDTAKLRRGRRLRSAVVAAAGFVAVAITTFLLTRAWERPFSPAPSSPSTAPAVEPIREPQTAPSAAPFAAPSASGHAATTETQLSPAARPPSRRPAVETASPSLARSRAPVPAATPIAMPTPIPTPAAPPPDTPVAREPEALPAPAVAPRETGAQTQAIEAAELSVLVPQSARRKETTLLEVRGRGLRDDHRPKILRSRRDADGVRVLRYQRVDASLLLVTVLVEEDAPLGAYSVVLVDGQGRLTNSLSLDVIL